MKTNMKLNVLAVIIAALMSSPAAFANGGGHNGGGGDNGGDDPAPTSEDEHDVSVSLEKDLSLSSDIDVEGYYEIGGYIDIDSQAIAVVDNRQSITDNYGTNDKVTNTASIEDDVASDASGNIGVNAAAGDNNTQDNAAALSAADASFSFGLSDAEVFVNQYGAGNETINEGVTNNAYINGNAFSGATGNIGVNVTSGNNNEQKNALAASVATSAVAQASVSSNQVSTGNAVSNAGSYETIESSVDVELTGNVTGTTNGIGEGTYSGRGNAYQQSNLYPDTWSGDTHPSGDQTGHIDLDNEAQGAVANPYRDGVGGLAFDTDEEGDLSFEEETIYDLAASLSGTVTSSNTVAVNAINTASLADSAFSGASGNIGVNVSAGTGNLQANSLALAVAQPSTGSGETP